MPRLLRFVVTAALLVLAAAGCGRGEGVRTTAETEGLYLDIGGLKYQVQLSRYINPADPEDAEYLAGLPESTAEPQSDETWFGVWVRVQNVSGETRRAADTWEIHDTQENVYRPIPIDREDNPFIYDAVDVPPDAVLPQPDTAAAQGPIQGLLLLFKLKTESLQNRPLELKFSHGAQGQVATYDLDV
jgi:hypothetical protein